ncbi:hypothetical protein ACNIU2_26760, partial [Escherichia coli]
LSPPSRVVVVVLLARVFGAAGEVGVVVGRCFSVSLCVSFFGGCVIKTFCCIVVKTFQAVFAIVGAGGVVLVAEFVAAQ